MLLTTNKKDWVGDVHSWRLPVIKRTRAKFPIPGDLCLLGRVSTMGGPLDFRVRLPKREIKTPQSTNKPPNNSYTGGGRHSPLYKKENSCPWDSHLAFKLWGQVQQARRNYHKLSFRGEEIKQKINRMRNYKWRKCDWRYQTSIVLKKRGRNLKKNKKNCRRDYVAQNATCSSARAKRQIEERHRKVAHRLPTTKP